MIFTNPERTLLQEYDFLSDQTIKNVCKYRSEHPELHDYQLGIIGQTSNPQLAGGKRVALFKHDDTNSTAVSMYHFHVNEKVYTQHFFKDLVLVPASF